jgi:hypothetical protein
MEKFSSFMINNQKTTEYIEGGGWNIEEINPNRAIKIKSEKGGPIRRFWRRPRSMRHVSSDSGLRNIKPKDTQLGMNTRRAPGRILVSHGGN